MERSPQRDLLLGQVLDSAGRRPASPRTAPRSRDAPGRRSSPPGWGDPLAARSAAPLRDTRRGRRGTPAGSAGSLSRGRGPAPCGRKGSGPRDSRRATSFGPSSFSPETSFASRSGPRPRRRPAASESACGRGRATAAGTPPAPRRAAGPARRTSRSAGSRGSLLAARPARARMVRERVERQDERRLRCHLVTRHLRGVSLANTTNRD